MRRETWLTSLLGRRKPGTPRQIRPWKSRTGSRAGENGLPSGTKKPTKHSWEHTSRKEATDMLHSPKELTPSVSNIHLLLAYVADLELEVDRLRKQGQFVQHEVRESLK